MSKLVKKASEHARRKKIDAYKKASINRLKAATVPITRASFDRFLGLTVITIVLISISLLMVLLG